jgi:hypothetical protein
VWPAGFRLACLNINSAAGFQHRPFWRARIRLVSRTRAPGKDHGLLTHPLAKAHRASSRPCVGAGLTTPSAFWSHQSMAATPPPLQGLAKPRLSWSTGETDGPSSSAHHKTRLRQPVADIDCGLILAGGAAGVAAAFNTPLAGVTALALVSTSLPGPLGRARAGARLPAVGAGLGGQPRTDAAADGGRSARTHFERRRLTRAFVSISRPWLRTPGWTPRCGPAGQGAVMFPASRQASAAADSLRRDRPFHLQ